MGQGRVGTDARLVLIGESSRFRRPTLVFLCQEVVAVRGSFVFDHASSCVS